MTDEQYMAVFNLWYARTLTGQYLSDIPPYNLTPSELGSLITDSFYIDIPSQFPVDPFHFRKFKMTRKVFNNHINASINMHLKAMG